ncbi:MAG: uracil-DNA glycosylase [Pyrinomonadaceae bacterium]
MPEAAEITELISDVREQVLYLQELGVAAFDLKLTGRVESRESRVESQLHRNTSATIIPDLRFGIPKPADPPPAGSRLALLPSLLKRPMSSLPRGSEAGSAGGPTEIKTASKRSNAVEISTIPESSETIEQIRAEIGPDCTRCKLSALGRTQVVNSTGNFRADLMFIGEAPGADEDVQGFPFVGRAGKLLTDIMMAIGFSRDDVFIGNINRCRPPGNRAPEPDETIACKPFLIREIAVVRPSVIVVLGATAAQNLLETRVPIGKLRGQFHDYLGTKVMPTFHPAYLLRDPHKKREVWEDMKMVRDYLTSVK